MPLITFEGGKLTDEMKKELITKLTDVATEITGIPKNIFYISIREMPFQNVAIGGRPVKEMKNEIFKK